jgi:hypothetical protein
LLATLFGCQESAEPAGLIAHARFGVFYGGQVQERQEVLRVLEPSQQSLGFRIAFRRPLAEAARIRWEVEQPGTTRDSNSVFVTKLGEVTAQVGQVEIDQLLRFEPGDPVGLWNVRVLVERDLVIDRAWLVFDASARKRAEQRQEE